MELSSPFVQPVLKITGVMKLSSPFVEPVLKITRVNGAVLAFSRACTEDH